MSRWGIVPDGVASARVGNVFVFDAASRADRGRSKADEAGGPEAYPQGTLRTRPAESNAGDASGLTAPFNPLQKRQKGRGGPHGPPR